MIVTDHAEGKPMPGITVEVIEAWPRAFRRHGATLPAGAAVADALDAVGIARDAYPAVAVFGERVGLDHALVDGDRVELLRGLLADPKEARRRRAGDRATRPGARKAPQSAEG